MRNTSLTFRQAINAQETQEVVIVLVEIDHDTLSEPIRICSGGLNVVSGGNTYVYYPFELTLPDDVPDSIPSAQLTIANVDSQIIASIRSISTPPTVNMKVVLASSPSTIEAEATDFLLTNVTYDANTIQATVSIEDFMTEPFPGDSFIPSVFPGIF